MKPRTYLIGKVSNNTKLVWDHPNLKHTAGILRSSRIYVRKGLGIHARRLKIIPISGCPGFRLTAQDMDITCGASVLETTPWIYVYHS